MDSTWMLKRDFKKRTQNWAEEGVELDTVEGAVNTVDLYGMEFPKTKTRKKRDNSELPHSFDSSLPEVPVLDSRGSP